MDPLALRAARPKDSGVGPIDTNINKTLYVLVDTVIKLHDTRF